MDLKINDIVQLLDLPEKTVRSLISKKNIPFYRVKNQCYFNRGEIHEWVLKNDIQVSEKILELKLTEKPIKISRLIERGGIRYNVRGKDAHEVIYNSVSLLPGLHGVIKKDIISSFIERENLMTTAVGGGIALPHSRNPILADPDEELISLCLLEHPVDFMALDRVPVHTLFLIISSSPRRHLEILSKLTFLCRSNDLISVLEKRERSEIVSLCIEKIEKSWEKR
jgi:nitrogen PTS system EIIA component